MTPRRRISRASTVVLIGGACLAVLTGVMAVVMGTAAPAWILAQLAGTGVVTDAAAVGGAVAALGYAALLAGAGLLGLALALRAGRAWARPAATVVVGAVLAALIGSLGAALSSIAREPGSGLLYVLAAGGIGLAIIAFGMVLRDLLRGTGGPD